MMYGDDMYLGQVNHFTTSGFLIFIVHNKLNPCDTMHMFSITLVFNGDFTEVYFIQLLITLRITCVRLGTCGFSPTVQRHACGNVDSKFPVGVSTSVNGCL